MTARLLNGKELAQRIRYRVADEAARFAAATGAPPGLAVVQVGEDPASTIYVRNKESAAQEAGLAGQVVRLPAATSRGEILETVGRLAGDAKVHGLLVQLPLPAHLDPWEIQAAVPPAKDVDGFHPENAGKLLLGRPDGLVPCTPRGVMALLDEAGADLKGAEVVVVGRSNIVGKPVALLLLARHATVALCHSRTRDLAAVCRRADVIVAATGVPGLLRAPHIRPGAIVIDVGVNEIRDIKQAEDLLAGQPERLERFRRTGRALVGDVHFAEGAAVAAAITPVPGGVGPLTVALLLENTVIAARQAAGLGH